MTASFLSSAFVDRSHLSWKYLGGHANTLQEWVAHVQSLTEVAVQIPGHVSTIEAVLRNHL